METIKELREICQKPVIHSAGESWYGIYFSRKISIYITYFIVRFTKLSANFVTFLFILLGAIGDVFLAFGKPVYALAGVFLLHLWLILDAVDGEVARYRKKSSVFGIYLDSLGHYIVNPGILMGLGLYVSKVYESDILFYLALISFLIMVFLRLFDDLYYLTVSKTQNSSNKRYSIDKEKETKSEEISTSRKSPIKTFINILGDDSVLVVILTLVFALDMVYPVDIVILAIFVGYVALYSLMAMYSLYKNMRKMS